MSYLMELMKSTAAPFTGKATRTERKLRQDLARFGKMLHSMGFVAATDGNLSVRLDQDRVLVTPTCFSKGMMRPEDMVIVDLHGKKLSGTYNPSSEIVMH
ncbi:MAG TPA: class II aldolase/adducin family protein, partial [Terriglobales bacterium]